MDDEVADIMIYSGILRDKSVSEPSHLHTIEELTASAWSTMLQIWTPSTTLSNGFRKSTATQQRVSTSCS
jgi:hypothetical protein